MMILQLKQGMISQHHQLSPPTMVRSHCILHVKVSLSRPIQLINHQIQKWEQNNCSMPNDLMIFTSYKKNSNSGE